MRTVYRRTFLIAPWVNPYRFTNNSGVVDDDFTYDGDSFKAEPGLVRILPRDTTLEEAIAAIIAFQDRYDLSVRLEWDNNLTPPRWKIMANTLADLTKRENRYGHYGYLPDGGAGQPRRFYPYPAISWGFGYSGNNAGVAFVSDPEVGGLGNNAQAQANLEDAPPPGPTGMVTSYTNNATNVTDSNRYYRSRPFAFVDADSDGGLPATTQAMLNDDGAVVRVVHGPVPLWGARRGEDIMMTGVLGFDVRVYDPGAPLFGVRRDPTNANSPIDTVLQPSDPGWAAAYLHADHDSGTNIGDAATAYPFVGQGAYVDTGYQYNRLMLPSPYAFQLPGFANSAATYPWFFRPRGMMDTVGTLLTPGYTAYDTWSFHYENNGVDEDNRDGDNNLLTGADEATNGLDDTGFYWDPVTQTYVPDIRLGADDAGERETVPPYDKPLRGMQVLIRTYEPDSRAIRQVRVNQHFLPE
jgi:hypothetical protein